MTYREARKLLGQMKTARLHARQRNDYMRADVLSNKIRLLKTKLRTERAERMVLK